MNVYREKYEFATDNIDAIRYQAREEIAMKKMMDREGRCKAFANTFQDLYGMGQLPGLASQHLMAQGYGYGGEGDWKVSAMTAILKAMGEGGDGRVRLHGGLYLSSCQGSGIQPRRTHARRCPRALPAPLCRRRRDPSVPWA